MTEYFRSLSEQDYTKLKDAIPLITLLIGGADGDLDQNEKEWAEKITKIRAYKMSEDLIGFYREVGVDYHDRLEQFIEELPDDVDERTAAISTKLEELNPVMASIDQTVAYHLYKSYKSFAKHVAKASGGLFGFFSIGPHEKALLGLPMLDPIEAPEDYEEEE
jgi:hypothetical protein